MPKKTVSHGSGAGVLTDKGFLKVLTNIDEEFDIFPEVPPDKEEFSEDVKNAFKKMGEDGKPFFEETKTKFILLEKKVKDGFKR